MYLNKKVNINNNNNNNDKNNNAICIQIPTISPLFLSTKTDADGKRSNKMLYALN